MNFDALRRFTRLLPLTSVSTLACHLILGDYTIEPVPLARACVLGEARCVGAERQRCLLGGWQVEEVCDSPGDCNLVLETCSPCEPETYRCNDGVPQRCGTDGSWLNQPACTPARACRVDNSSENPSQRGYFCSQAVCPRPLAYACNDGVLQRCSRDQDRWETIEVCSEPALCDVRLAEAQAEANLPVRCAPPQCLPEQYRCEGGTARACVGGRWSSSPTPEAQASCAAPCAPGATRCSGVTPYRCNAAGAWERAAPEDCASPSLCDASDGTCEEQPCPTAGGFECAPHGPDSSAERLLRCRADLSELEPVDLCPLAEACDALNGRCLPTLCQAGAFRCNGSQFELCSGTAWQGVDSQGTNALCPSTCSPGMARCNDRYLEECAPDGTWQRLAACATPQRCDAMNRQCLDPACDPASLFRCAGDTLEKCKEEQDGYVPLASCAPGQCDATLGRCRKGP